jgi:aspartyl-tRNA(Asn)/glutamyl-tRNA(Gln) amidotransferase subunit A
MNPVGVLLGPTGDDGLMTDDADSLTIAGMTALELAARYRQRTLSPVEATRACLGRIERLDGEVNAFVLVDPDAALTQAVAAETRLAAGEPLGPLDGVPVAVKDLLLTAGWPTRRGSLTIDPAQPWTEDAPSVARLRDAGAVLIGKTTTPELGWKGVTDSPLTGITRNPWNLECTAGGSSGGSSAAVAAGLVPLALGTDGGGSIRIPAAFSGIVGHKPTYGRVALHPPSPYGTLAHVGPMARTVGDTAALLDVISGVDRRDPTSFPSDPIDALVATPLDGLRVGFCLDQSVCPTEPDVVTAFEAAVAWFADRGARVEPVDLRLDGMLDVFETLWFAGAAAALAGNPADRHLMDPGLVAIEQAGRGTSAVGYLAAQQLRTQFASGVEQQFGAIDVLITPTTPMVAFEAGVEAPAGWPRDRWTTWTPWTWAFNLTQQPAVSLPCGLSGNGSGDLGLPIGLQIVAARHRDDLALAVAAAFEADHPLNFHRPFRAQSGHD